MKGEFDLVNPCFVLVHIVGRCNIVFTLAYIVYLLHILCKVDHTSCVATQEFDHGW